MRCKKVWKCVYSEYKLLEKLRSIVRTCSTMAFCSIFWNFLSNTSPTITSDGTTSKSLKKSDNSLAMSAKEFLFLSLAEEQQNKKRHLLCQLSWYALRTFLQIEHPSFISPIIKIKESICYQGMSRRNFCQKLSKIENLGTIEISEKPSKK